MPHSCVCWQHWAPAVTCVAGLGKPANASSHISPAATLPKHSLCVAVPVPVPCRICKILCNKWWLRLPAAPHPVHGRHKPNSSCRICKVWQLHLPPAPRELKGPGLRPPAVCRVWARHAGPASAAHLPASCSRGCAVYGDHDSEPRRPVSPSIKVPAVTFERIGRPCIASAHALHPAAAEGGAPSFQSAAQSLLKCAQALPCS